MKLDKFELDKKLSVAGDEAGQSRLSEHNLRWKNSNFKMSVGTRIQAAIHQTLVSNHS